MRFVHCVRLSGGTPPTTGVASIRRSRALARMLGALTFCVVLGAACKGKSELGFESRFPETCCRPRPGSRSVRTRTRPAPPSVPCSRTACPKERPRASPSAARMRRARRLARSRAAATHSPRWRGDKDCGVLATGCKTVDLGDAESISIGMKAVEKPTGTCSDGSVCEAAKCVPASGKANPNVGANCSLSSSARAPSSTLPVAAAR